MAKSNSMIGRTVGVYGEAYVQFVLATRGWVVDAIGTTANGIDLLAWKESGPNMGLNVKTRMRNTSGSVTLFKDDKLVEAMRKECALRGVEPYIAVVVFNEHDNRGYLMSLDVFLSRYRRQPRATTKTIEFYRTASDEAKYEADPDVIKLSGAGTPPTHVSESFGGYHR